MAKNTGYELSRIWWNFCFENPEKISPTHTALYFFAIEHCNRLGWKEKFGLPTEMAKDAIGIKSWHTYIRAFNDIVEWGFFTLIEKSKNQYSSNIIALIKNDKALDKALDKAITKHASKQPRSTHQSNDSIDKQIQNNTEPITNTEQYIRPRDFLIQTNEIEFEQMQVMSRLGTEFETCIEQWSLSIEGQSGEKAFKYSGDKSEDYRILKALAQKWINSWNINSRERNKKQFNPPVETTTFKRIVRSNV